MASPHYNLLYYRYRLRLHLVKINCLFGQKPKRLLEYNNSLLSLVPRHKLWRHTRGTLTVNLCQLTWTLLLKTAAILLFSFTDVKTKLAFGFINITILYTVQ